MTSLGVPIYSGSAIVAACGRTRVKAVRVASVEGGRITGVERNLNADLIAVSGGWTPTLHLHVQAEGSTRFCERTGAFVPDDGPTLCAGAVNGTTSIKRALDEGEATAAKAIAALGLAPAKADAVSSQDLDSEEVSTPRPLFMVRKADGTPIKGKQFVDFQNDVTAADIQLAAREGYVSVEHLKRYTTLGMGTDQGKLSNLNGANVMAHALSNPLDSVGMTTCRPPFTPLSFAAVAGPCIGDTFKPTRKTPSHAIARDKGAEFECVGDWLRARVFLRQGEDHDAAVRRECRAVREAVGVFDASTLGKISIQGPDAVTLINRLYTGSFSKLKVGRSRYGLMLNENGMVFDDGVTTRIGENSFHMTTTSGGAAHVMGAIEEWLQTEWTDLDVFCTSTTDAFAAIAVSGPRARELVQRLEPDFSLESENFPFMSTQKGSVAGIPVRAFRISFTGELGYELCVPTRFGGYLFQTLLDLGRDLGATPYGTDAMHVLRAEKGFIICGQDTDGTVTPYDLGLGGMVNQNKGDFIGKRSLTRAGMSRAPRKQLVGLLPERKDFLMPRGLALKSQSGTLLGHVSSTYFSDALGRTFGLGLVFGGLERAGQKLLGQTLGGASETIEVTEPVFIDKDGVRARV